MTADSPTDAARPLAPEPDRKPWWPALDALRGVAVVAVLLFHHDPSRWKGGFLGVSLFFTLSGFLIANLVLVEHRRRGRVSLGRFWARRFRRLAPVGLAGLGLAVAVAAATHRPDIAAIGGDVTASALHVFNWRAAGSPLGYGDTFAPPSPVSHYWSLAIEEQFYVVFPLVCALALRRGRLVLAVVLALATAASVARQLSLTDANRIYLGTDTRAAELAVGCLAAIAWSARDALPTHVRRAGTVALDAGGLVAVAGLAALWRSASLSDAWLYRGGLLLHAALAAVLVVACVGGRAVPLVVAARPLVSVGRISYGIYVVHLPLFLLLDRSRTGLDGWPLLLARFAATVAVAAALHVLVEQPVRSGGALPRRQAHLAWGAATAAVLLLAVAVPEARELRAAATAGTGRGGVGADVVDAAEGAPGGGREAGAVAAPGVDPGGTAAPVVGPAPPAAAPAPSPPTSVAPGEPHDETDRPAAPGGQQAERPVPHVLVVGDSTARANGQGMAAWAARTGAITVQTVSGNGCAFLQTGVLHVREGWDKPTTPECLGLVDAAVAAARSNPPDLVVVFDNSMQIGEWRLDGDDRFRTLEDPWFLARFHGAADDVLGALSALGVPVLVADVPVPAWVPELTAPFPGLGPPTINDPARTAVLNAAQVDAARRHRLARVASFVVHAAGADGEIAVADRPDGLHLTSGAVEAAMDAGFAEELRRRYVEVTSVHPGSRGPTTWSP